MKKIVLCADDYNQNPTISAGIIDLVAKRRITAVSCFSTLPHWQQNAERLLAYQHQVDIGLHFNLTESSEFPSLRKLILQAFLKKIDLNHVEKILNEQLDQFIVAIGKVPDFIDGHQHVHHLPGIRDVLLKVYEQRLRSHHTYLRIASTRSVYHPLRIGFPKNLIIRRTGASILKKRVLKTNIPHNLSFSGIYPFKKSQNYSRYFRHFLSLIGNGGLIMCHPGLQSNDNNDSIAESRWFEYQYLASDQFIEDCAEKKIVLTSFKGISKN